MSLRLTVVGFATFVLMFVCGATEAAQSDWQRWVLAVAQRGGEDRTGLDQAVFEAVTARTGSPLKPEDVAQRLQDVRKLKAGVAGIDSARSLGEWLQTDLVRKYKVAYFIPTSTDDSRVVRQVRRLAEHPWRREFLRADLSALERQIYTGTGGIVFGIPPNIDAATLAKGFTSGHMSPRTNSLLHTLAQGGLDAKGVEDLTKSLVLDASASVQASIQTAFSNRVPSRTASAALTSFVSEPGIRGFSTVSEAAKKIEGLAAAVGTVGMLTGDKRLQKLSLDAMKYTKAAMQIKDACMLLASTGTGWGGVVALTGMVSGMKGLTDSNASQEATAGIMQALSQMFEFLEGQFSLVNSKLDTIIGELGQIRQQLAQIGADVETALQRLRDVEAKLDLVAARLERMELNIIDEITRSRTGPCLRYGAEGVRSDQVGFEFEFVKCIDAFLRVAEQARGTTYQLRPVGKERASAIVLRELPPGAEADLDSGGQALTALGLSEIALGRTDLGAVLNVPNPRQLMSAITGYLVMAADYPDYFQRVNRNAEIDQLVRLVDQVDAYVLQLSQSGRSGRAFGFGAPMGRAWRKENFNVVIEAYQKALISAATAVLGLYGRVVDERIEAMMKGPRYPVEPIRECAPKPGPPAISIDVSASDLASVPQEFFSAFGRPASVVEGVPARSVSAAPTMRLRICIENVELYDLEYFRRGDPPQWGTFRVTYKVFFGQREVKKSKWESTQTGKRATVHGQLWTKPTEAFRVSQVDGMLGEIPILFKDHALEELKRDSKTLTSVRSIAVESLRKDMVLNSALVGRKIAADASVPGPSGLLPISRLFEALDEAAAVTRAHALIGLREFYANSDVFRMFIGGSTDSRIVDTGVITEWLACSQKVSGSVPGPVITWQLNSCSPGIREAVAAYDAGLQKYGVGELHGIMADRYVSFRNFIAGLDWDAVPDPAFPELSIARARLRALRQ